MNRIPILSLIFFIVLTTPSIKAQEPPPQVSVDTMNELLGIDLWSDDSLWDDPVADVADRLDWPQEGKTSTQSSYRYYPQNTYQVMGITAYTSALYGIDSHPDRISIMFSNKGDYPSFKGNEHPSRDQIKEFEDELDTEEEKIVTAITALLGEPKRGKIGKGKRLRERIQRWDWNGHSILLSVQDGEYVSLRITKPDFADNKGITDSVSDSKLRKKLQEHVLHRKNGDVVLTGIPMADQGPKGYCVPATWERYLRYLDIPADMYILARAGSSGYGGGTYLKPISEAVNDLAHDYGRKLNKIRANLDPRKVARYIDKGLPIMWAVYADSLLYQETLTQRSQERLHVTDWEKWKTRLEEVRTSVKDADNLRKGEHVCMIIGYNEDTGELATTDSWGPDFEERWMTVEEAEAITQGTMQIVRW